LQAVANSGKMVVGVKQALAILEDFRPEVCFVTGGYVCTPVVIACRMRNVPVLIYLPDMTPGLAIRSLAFLAQRVAVTYPEVARYFGSKGVATGYPVREELSEAVRDRALARQQLSSALDIRLDPAVSGDGLPLLLVFGGSQGARSINLAIWRHLEQLLPHSQILHVVGARDWNMVDEHVPDLPPDLAERYFPVSYLHQEMAWALASADLVVARAGASTLGEFPVAYLPAVLVPLPIAGGHQRVNAEKLAQVGGAVIIDDAELERKLAPTVVELLNNAEKRLQMGAAMASLARPNAALQIGRELVALSV
jgi:UDP-N-acetylglucosamine--N-acetylmuramyl-(pentapeptide) pyrophosphoryl-undecaprenol N-acetylglucosamine transferase